MLKTKLENQIEDEGGFTLVELLVVILIIGILAAIAIPIFMNQRKTSNDAAVESDVKNLATQIETALVSAPNATTVELGTDEGEDFTAVTGEEGITGTGTVKVSGAGEGEGSFNLSDEVTVTVNITSDDGVVANGYTIKGWHSNGNNYTGSGEDALEFNSAKGGLISDSEDSGDEG